MSRYQGKREAPKPERERPQRKDAAAPQRAAGSSGQQARNSAADSVQRQRVNSDSSVQRQRAGKRPSRNRYRGLILGLAIAVAVILALVLVFKAVWNSIVKPPDIPDIDSGLSDGVDGGDGGDAAVNNGLGTLSEGVLVDDEMPDYVSEQKDGVYTFLLIGRTSMDDNADMLMLIVFDSNTGEIDACSIPRDTMINVEKDLKKINSTIFAGVNNTKKWVRKTLGIQPNFYVMVDWQAVGDMVDAVGGIYYDVPIPMHYIDDDPENGFTIDLWQGYQLMDGDKAMQFIRWRKNNVYQWEINAAKKAGFDGSDTKRTEMQQNFIVEAAKQILQVKNLKYLGSMVQVFKDNVETDLSIGNLAWFAQKALELDSAHKVTFHSLPGDYLNSCFSRTFKHLSPSGGAYQSYVTFYPNQLLELVNTHLNPYESDIRLSDLDLMSINADGTISSSTGVVADTEHAVALQAYKDVQAGLAYYDEGGNVQYYEDPENPDDPSGTDDPNAPVDPDDPNVPPEDNDPDSDDPGDVTDPGTEDPGMTGPEADDPVSTEEPDEPVQTGSSDPNDPDYDPWMDPNYDPDPWSDAAVEYVA